jgi:hypothetical protein
MCFPLPLQPTAYAHERTAPTTAVADPEFIRWNYQTKEISMKKQVGLWIDHKKAVVIAMTDKGEETGLILSEAEKQLRRSGDSPLKGPFKSQQLRADDKIQRAFTEHLNVYYDEVIASIRDAEAILIFGPGEAKNELKVRLAGKKLDGHVVGIQPADKMTDHQIAAKVRQHFAV